MSLITNTIATTGTEVFDPTAPVFGASADGISLESRLGSIGTKTLALEQRRVAARQLLSGICTDDTISSILTISSNLGTHEETIVRARIAIGGHFQSILYAIQKDLLSDGDFSDQRKKLALQVTYQYIEVVHNYSRPVARNHMLVYHRFAQNTEALRLLNYSEMLMLASEIKDEDDVALLLDKKQETDMSPTDFRALTRGFSAKLKLADQKFEQLADEAANSEAELFIKSSEFGRLQIEHVVLQKTLTDTEEKLQHIESARSEMSTRLNATRIDAQAAAERVQELEAQAVALKQQIRTAKTAPPGTAQIETNTIEVLPPGYLTKLEALAATEKELSQKQGEVQALEATALSRQQELANTEQLLKDSSQLLATSQAMKEIVDGFSQFHTTFVTAQLKVAVGRIPEPFRQVLMEIDSRMQNMHMEILAAINHGD